MLWAPLFRLGHHLFRMKLLSKWVKQSYCGAGLLSSGLFNNAMWSGLKNSLLDYGGWGMATTAATGISTATGIATNFLNIACSAQQAPMSVFVEPPQNIKIGVSATPIMKLF